MLHIKKIIIIKTKGYFETHIHWSVKNWTALTTTYIWSTDSCHRSVNHLN